MPFVYSFLPNALQRLIWIPTRLLFFFFIHLKIRGATELKRIPRGVIFAVNHSGELDSLIVPAALPFFSTHLPMFYTSREKSFYKRSGWRQSFYGGTFFKLWGAYPVRVGTHNYEESLSRHVEFLRDGRSICIFPEGGTTPDGNLRPAKGGIAYLAWRTGSPIIPVRISNIWKLGFRGFISRKRNVTISFGNALFTKELFEFCKGVPVVNEERDDFKQAAQRVMEEIRSLTRSS